MCVALYSLIASMKWPNGPLSLLGLQPRSVDESLLKDSSGILHLETNSMSSRSGVSECPKSGRLRTPVMLFMIDVQTFRWSAASKFVVEELSE